MSEKTSTIKNNVNNANNVNNVNNINSKSSFKSSQPTKLSTASVLNIKSSPKLTSFFQHSNTNSTITTKGTSVLGNKNNSNDNNNNNSSSNNDNANKNSNNNNNNDNNNASNKLTTNITTISSPQYNNNTNFDTKNNNKNNNNNNKTSNIIHSKDSSSSLYLTSYSNNQDLQLKLNTHELLHLPDAIKNQLLQDIDKFLHATKMPLLLISKRMSMMPVLPYEEYHNYTASNGYCFFIMLLQLQNRHLQRYQSQLPVEIDIFNNLEQREELTSFISEMIDTYSIDPNHPDMAPFRTAYAYLLQQRTSLDSADYISLEFMHLFKFPFPITGWTKRDPVDNYLAFTYSNTIGDDYNFAAYHSLTYDSYSFMVTNPNDFHQNFNHFYCVPTVESMTSRLANLSQAITNIKPQVVHLLRPQLASQIPPVIQPNIPSQPILNQVSIGPSKTNPWARLSLVIPTIRNLTPPDILSALSDPLSFLMQSNLPLLTLEQKSTYSSAASVSIPTYPHGLSFPLSYSQLLSNIQRKADTASIGPYASFLLRGLTILHRRLLILIPQISTNHIPHSPIIIPMQCVRGADANDLIRLDVSREHLPLFYFHQSIESVRQALSSTITPTIHILKRLQIEHFHTTLTDGHCLPLSLYQSKIRSTNSLPLSNLSQPSIPPCLQHISSLQDKETYKQWLRTLKQESSPLATSLRKQLQDVYDKAHTHNPVSQWFNSSVFPDLHIPWRMTLWEMSSVDQYSSPVWTNHLDEDFKAPIQLTTHNYQQIVSLLRGSNDIELSSNHYYLLPSNTTTYLLIAFEEAITNLAKNIYEILQTSRQHQSSPNTNVTPPCPLVTNVDDLSISQDSSSLTTPSKSHPFFDSSYRTYDLTALNETICNDRFFSLQSSRDILLHQLRVSTNVCRLQYPDLPIRQSLQYILERSIPKTSTICDELGLYANTPSSTPPIRPGEIVGIYAGPRTTTRNSYTMHITNDFEIGDNPDPNDEWTKFGYINEFIWDRNKCNCVIDEFGIIRASTPIKHNEELFISYGQEYQWDHLKSQYHHSLLDALVKMSTILPSAPNESLLRETYTSALQNVFHTGFQKLLIDFFAYESKDPRSSFPIHDSLPHYDNGDILEWIEIVLRCRWFYEQQCFRKHQDPNQQLRNIQSSLDLIPSGPPESLRRSSRKKPVVSYIGLQDSEEDEPPHKHRKSLCVSYYLHPLTSFPVQLLYQYSMPTHPISRSSSNLSSASSPPHCNPQPESPHMYSPAPTSDSLTPEFIPTNDPDIPDTQDVVPPPLQQQQTSPRIPLPSCQAHADRLDALADKLLPPRHRHYPTVSSLTTMSFNINGRCEVRERAIIDLIRNKHIDITSLIDVRVATGSVVSYTKHLHGL